MSSTSTVIESGHAEGMCLAIASGKAVLESCSTAAAQKFSVDGERIRVGDLCIATSTKQGWNGDRLVAEACSGASNQKWSFNTKGEIRGVGGRCIDISGLLKTAGTAIISWKCHGASNQQWKVTQVALGDEPSPEEQPSGTTIASRHAAEMCLLIENGLAVLGSCDEAGSDQFAVESDRIRAGELCLATQTGTGGEGDRVIVAPCSSDANQKWTATSESEIRGIGNLCVDIYGARKDAGTPIIIWSCHGGSNQIWALDGTVWTAPDTVPATPTDTVPEAPTDTVPETPTDTMPADPSPEGRTGWFVSPNGSSAGNGSMDRPWDLATALSHPDAVEPGDTIWVRGGAYVGAYTSDLMGTPSQPIIVRAVPGERATIATPDAQPASLMIRGGYTWFWGLEVTNTAASPPSWGGGAGVQVDASIGIRLVHLTIHDAWASGVQWAKTAAEGEVYGVLGYHNGRNSVLSPGKGGYGIYAQSNTGVTIRDNIFGPQGGNYSIHVYAQDADLHDVHLIGNIVNSGGGGRWMHLGGFRPSYRPVVKDNLVYASGVDIGYQDPTWSGGTVDALVENNVLATRDRPTVVTNAKGNFRFRGNTLWGGWSGVGPSTHPDNKYLTSKPTGQQVYVRPSAYEAGRAHVAVYNWSAAGSATLDLSSVLRSGDSFTIHDASDPFAQPIAQGTWGGSVSVPLGGAEFRALVVQKR